MAEIRGKRPRDAVAPGKHDSRERAVNTGGEQ
jgi:hypothetical protein